MWVLASFREEIPDNTARLLFNLEIRMGSFKRYLLGPAVNSRITQISPHGISPIKVAIDVPILEDKTAAQRREVTELR